MGKAEEYTNLIKQNQELLNTIVIEIKTLADTWLARGVSPKEITQGVFPDKSPEHRELLEHPIFQNILILYREFNETDLPGFGLSRKILDMISSAIKVTSSCTPQYPIPPLLFFNSQAFIKELAELIPRSCPWEIRKFTYTGPKEKIRNIFYDRDSQRIVNLPYDWTPLDPQQFQVNNQERMMMLLWQAEELAAKWEHLGFNPFPRLFAYKASDNHGLVQNSEFFHLYRELIIELYPDQICFPDALLQEAIDLIVRCCNKDVLGHTDLAPQFDRALLLQHMNELTQNSRANGLVFQDTPELTEHLDAHIVYDKVVQRSQRQGVFNAIVKEALTMAESLAEKGFVGIRHDMGNRELALDMTASFSESKFFNLFLALYQVIHGLDEPKDLEASTAELIKAACACNYMPGKCALMELAEVGFVDKEWLIAKLSSLLHLPYQEKFQYTEPLPPAIFYPAKPLTHYPDYISEDKAKRWSIWIEDANNPQPLVAEVYKSQHKQNLANLIQAAEEVGKQWLLQGCAEWGWKTFEGRSISEGTLMDTLNFRGIFLHLMRDFYPAETLRPYKLIEKATKLIKLSCCNNKLELALSEKQPEFNRDLFIQLLTDFVNGPGSRMQGLTFDDLPEPNGLGWTEPKPLPLKTTISEEPASSADESDSLVSELTSSESSSPLTFELPTPKVETKTKAESAHPNLNSALTPTGGTTAAALNMRLLGVFMTALGGFAVALALTVILGVPGVIVGTIGIAVALIGIGLFSNSFMKEAEPATNAMVPAAS